eukprot:scaffold2243_cov73-Cyclotella_meneghiniana.AAC.18
MECQNKGLWHLGISDEACENAGGRYYRTPCVTLKETIDDRPSRFDLENPMDGSCQTSLKKLETAFVSASSSDSDFEFEATLDGCLRFCQSLPLYSAQNGLTMTQSNNGDIDCTCLYQKGKLPSRDLMPSYAKSSPQRFTLINSDGLALGLQPHILCDAEDNLMVETQVGNPNNPRQQFEITQDGRVVSVRCPEKVLTAVLGSDGSCVDGVGLQVSNAELEAESNDASLLQQWTFNDNGSITNVKCPDLAISSNKEKDVQLDSVYFALQNPRTQLAIGTSVDSCTNGMTLEVQDLVYGSPNQQFMYMEDENKIVSLLCPEFAITIPDGDCSTLEGLYLSSDSYTDNRTQWVFDSNEVIQSVQCPNNFITIDGDLSGRARAVLRILREETFAFFGFLATQAVADDQDQAVALLIYQDYCH